MNALRALIFLFIFSPAIIFITYGKREERKLAIENPDPDFTSIDCGAAEDYNDTNGILYKSDEEFVDSGINGQVSTEFINNNHIQQQVKSLRSFPNGTRNCYTLNPRSGKNNKYLIRAAFLYGNYDGKNQVPVFDLYIGVNRWCTIDFSDYRNVEMVYVPFTDYIHVCLVKTGSGIPYISTLELRILNNSIYQIEAGALALVNRFSLGVLSGTRFYPDDVYDRIWTSLDPTKLFGWLTINTSSTIDSMRNDAYKLPYQVLTTAAKSHNSSIPLNFSWNLTMFNFPQYNVYFHFTEIENLEFGQQRQIGISFTQKNFMNTTISLEYLTPLTVASPPIMESVGKTSIYSTRGSAFPPILNAFEIFGLIKLPNSSTVPGDVDAMIKIKKEYQVITENWHGDPCAPIDYSWDGVNCSYTDLPRIISLNLSSSKLMGNISASFFELKAIESLDLSNNNLTGTLPEFLAELPNLKILKLSMNNFTGSVPQSLIKKHKEGSLQLRFGHFPYPRDSILLNIYSQSFGVKRYIMYYNGRPTIFCVNYDSLDEKPYLCQMNSCKKKSKKKFVIPVAASAALLLLLLLLLGALLIYRRIERRQHEGMVNKSKDLKSKCQRFSYSAIERITNKFQTVIGEGGFGKVFLGTLQDGRQVAVKLLSPKSNQGFNEFLAEAKLLMDVSHRNLVSLIGYCNEGQKMGLIYEYMDNGNLHQHLFESKENILSWKDRIQIALDTAHGLEYLHNGCKSPVIHRDLKPSNILLDKNMRAKIADFGLSKVFATESDTHVSTRPCGTPGYIDPEFHASGNLNKKSDVYSFGIVLFVLITGRPAIMKGPANQSSHIRQWVISAIERGNVENIIDSKLNGEFNYNTAWKAVKIALSCIPLTAIQRPDMSSVLSELKECFAMEMNTDITDHTTGSLVLRPTNSPETEYHTAN